MYASPSRVPSFTLTFPSLCSGTALRGPSLAAVAGGEAVADADDERYNKLKLWTHVGHGRQVSQNTPHPSGRGTKLTLFSTFVWRVSLMLLSETRDLLASRARCVIDRSIDR